MADARTKEGQKLVKGSYADRVLATLGGDRTLNQQIIHQLIGGFDPERITLKQRYDMRRDPMIAMGLHYREVPLTRADWHIECEGRPEVAAALEEMIRRVYVSWMKTSHNRYSFGYQAAVKQFEYIDLTGVTYEDPESGEVKPVWGDEFQAVGLGTPIPIPPEDATIKLKKGHYDGFETPLLKNEGQNTTNHIPATHSIWWTYEFEETFRNYYGFPLTGYAFRYWWSYWFNFHNRDRHAEQDADPSLQVWYPTGTYKEDGEKKSNRDAALAIGNDIRSGATIAWPSDVHVAEDGKMTSQRLWEAAFLQGGENLGAFTELLDDLNIMKLRATLVPEEALVASKNGQNSRASAGNYGQIFTESLEQEAMYNADWWTRHIIPDLQKANWADAPPAKMVVTGFKEEDMALGTELIKQAFNLDPNALPIKFEELVKRAGLPTYTKKEQQEREEDAAAAAAEAAQEQAALQAEAVAAGGGVGPLPGEQLPATAQQFAASAKPTPREVIHLSTPSTAPGWARREGQRRDRNVRSLAERLQPTMEAWYSQAFELSAEVVADTAVADLQGALNLDQNGGDLELGLRDAAIYLADRIRRAISSRMDAWRRPVEGEYASLYHTTGMAELSRLGLAAESWDVGRDEVQEWARLHAGELITTIDQTLVDQHVRPWLETALSQAGYGNDPRGIPVDTLELAAQLTDKFQNYPKWMAERVVRTESMRGYNLSAADMWERVGVDEVEMFDGLGGKSGQTDEHCLARNGRRATLDEFRQETLEEHPNGTLGAVPVTVGVTLRDLEPGLVTMNAAQSTSTYAVTEAGLILSEEETGRALAVS